MNFSLFVQVYSKQLYLRFPSHCIISNKILRYHWLIHAASYVSATSTTTTSTTTTTPAPTVPPSKQLDSKTDYLDMKFTFTDDYDAIVTSVDLFTSSLKSQLSTKTGIPEASIRNLKVEKGNNDDGCQFPC